MTPLITSGCIICQPIVITGLREASGSWKTREALEPRNGRSLRAGSPASSVPASRIDPLRVASVSRPRTARAVTDLPDPDSPTSATRAPGATSRSMPCTTSDGPVADG